MEQETDEGENRLQDSHSHSEVKEEKLADETAPDAEEEDEESLPHSEILDIFEEGLARLVQDPLLCDLPIQVIEKHHTPHTRQMFKDNFHKL